MRDPSEPFPTPAQQRAHVLDVRCANDLGVLIRVLNPFAVLRARLAGVNCAVDGEGMTLTVTAHGLTAAQSDNLQARVMGIEGVHAAAIANRGGASCNTSAMGEV